MRGLNKRGLNDLKTMGSYMALRKIKPDIILSSCALRTQLTADALAEKTGYRDRIHYMDELYLTRPEMALNVLSTQEDLYESIFFIGHNPALTELVNIFINDDFTKFPTLGIFALKLDIDSWKEIVDMRNAEIDFFIFPKQFKYYIPKQIRATLA
jgi:phosphohistidine phosphatase